jgi:chemotaxis protein methyltransferase CheR
VSALRRVAELIRRETGIVLKDPQLPALEAALGRVAPGVDPDGFVAEASGATAGRALLAQLIDEVTVQETYFFREPRELYAVDWRELHSVAAEAGADTVRVWVAACATGEEAYCLAILASEAFGHERPPVTIVATDVSNAALERSAEGAYSGRSLRDVPPELLERYFVATERGYRVRESIRSLVRFRHHNLVADPSPPPGEVRFDLVTCRNVLIYFDNETVKRVIGSLESAVRPGGRLILGAADRLTGVGEILDQPARGALWGRGSGPPAPKRRLRRPLGVDGPARVKTGADGVLAGREDRVTEALCAADAGDLDQAMAIAREAVDEDPLNPQAYFALGLSEYCLGLADEAVTSFRRALYVDPSFGLAAFQLGRAQDARGDARAARRAYAQALKTLDPAADVHSLFGDQVDLGDVAAACQVRLGSGSGARAA